MIPFNKPYLSGKELKYIKQSVSSGKISGDGIFTKKCQEFFQDKYNFKKALLTTSCTDALEMCAVLLNIQTGDEVIVPSFAFVSTANAFVLRGAKIVFADCESNSPNINVESIETLITSRTKAIVVIHYAGIACDMDKIMQLSIKHNLLVIEDAAHAIDSYYKDRPLGSIGHLSAFSFHETKNIISGEGGMLVINDEQFIKRAEIIREKGTNRSAFFRGETDKYGWVDIGSSFLPSDIIAAFLFAQLENIQRIQKKRKRIWDKYMRGLKALEIKKYFKLPVIPRYATNNAHMFFIVCNNTEERNGLIAYLKKKKVMAVFHYIPLHKSKFYQKKHDGRDLQRADFYSDCIVRLPLYYELKEKNIELIINLIKKYYELSYNG